jgi:hypothetical protein
MVYDANDIGSDKCMMCHGDFKPEQILRDRATGVIQTTAPGPGGRWCKPHDLACNIKACNSYQVGTNFEWLKCF